MTDCTVLICLALCMYDRLAVRSFDTCDSYVHGYPRAQDGHGHRFFSHFPQGKSSIQTRKTLPAGPSIPDARDARTPSVRPTAHPSDEHVRASVGRSVARSVRRVVSVGPFVGRTVRPTVVRCRLGAGARAFVRNERSERTHAPHTDAPTRARPRSRRSYVGSHISMLGTNRSMSVARPKSRATDKRTNGKNQRTTKERSQ